MNIIDVSRENWNEVAEAIAEHDVFMAVRVETDGGASYDLTVGRQTYRLPEDLAEELVREHRLPPIAYSRMYLVGFRRK